MKDFGRELLSARQKYLECFDLRSSAEEALLNANRLFEKATLEYEAALKAFDERFSSVKR